jgi:hypothetical protein
MGGLTIPLAPLESSNGEQMPSETTLHRSELAKIPFIDSDNIGNRTLTTLTFFDSGEWHMWFPMPTGLIPMKGQPVEADYFGRVAEKSADVYLEFLNFMTQRACWADALRSIDGIRDDIHNLGASLAKLELFHRSSRDQGIDIRRFASTEVEFIFGVCRSLFDLLQEVIAALWQRVELLDANVKKRQLPASFRRMVLKEEQLMAPEAIQARHHVPAQLASFYHRNGRFFQVLRRYRDDIVHSGRDFEFIFVTQKGFAVRADTEPFASFGVWNEEHMLPNRLASLRPVVSHVITATLLACEDFAQTIQQIIRFPPEIAPGFKLFMRGAHTEQLLAMKDVLKYCSWWAEP